MPTKPRPPAKIPKTLGACADALYTTRQTRLVEQKVIAGYKEDEKALQDHLIATLPKSDANGISGKLARATITTKIVPVIEDWELFYAHVRKTKNFALLQRRLNDALVEEMWAAGKKVPGVGTFTAVGVSVNKL